MKIITRGVLDMRTMKWLPEEEQSYKYRGPLALAGNFGALAANVFPLIPSGANASAPTTASGNWVDVENFLGDLLLVVNVGSVTGSFGSLKVQLQSASANTGSGAVNETLDPRNAGLLTITAAGTYAMPYGINYLSSYATSGNAGVGCFVGAKTTFTGITASNFSIDLVLDPRSK